MLLALEGAALSRKHDYALFVLGGISYTYMTRPALFEAAAKPSEASLWPQQRVMRPERRRPRPSYWWSDRVAQCLLASHVDPSELTAS